MNLKTLNLLLFIGTSVSSIWAQGAKLSDSGIELLPNWQKGDTHTIQITKIYSMDTPYNKTQDTSIYTFRYKVVDVDRANYVINWTSLSLKTSSKYKSTEEKILQNLLSNDISVQYSNTGQIVRILNKEALINKANQMLDGLIAKYKSETNYANSLSDFKTRLSNDDFFMAMLLKNISLYTLPFGNTFSTKKSKESTIDYQYSCMPLKIAADLVTQLKELDNNTTICTTIQDCDTKSKVLKTMFTNSTNSKVKSKSSWTLHQSITHTLNYSNSIVQNVHLSEKLDTEQGINITTIDIILLQ